MPLPGGRLAAYLILSLVSLQMQSQEHTQWTTPIAPFRIAGNLYYVGSQDLAAYLVVTPAGNVLINSNLETSVPQIRRSIEQLGFRIADVKILLISHAHFDHAAGSAAIVKLTGAKYEVMDGDVPVVESGGRLDFAYSAGTHYPPTKVDRVLHDGDEIRLGGTVLVAHKTPGHTRGCTTWTMQVDDHGRALQAVIVGSWNVNPGFRLVDTPRGKASYPGIAADFAHTFTVLRSLPCDLFLGAHGSYFDMLEKLARGPVGGASAWIDPAGYRRAITDHEVAFQAELRRQQHGARTLAGKAGIVSGGARALR